MYKYVDIYYTKWPTRNYYRHICIYVYIYNIMKLYHEIMRKCHIITIVPLNVYERFFHRILFPFLHSSARRWGAREPITHVTRVTLCCCTNTPSPTPAKPFENFGMTLRHNIDESVSRPSLDRTWVELEWSGVEVVEVVSSVSCNPQCASASVCTVYIVHRIYVASSPRHSSVVTSRFSIRGKRGACWISTSATMKFYGLSSKLAR